MICEACEAREVEQQQQQQQVELAYFQMFQRFLANQGEARILMDDSSNDTWQDVISPPSSFIGDSGAELATRESNCISTEPATTNCSLCRHLPNIIGHTFKPCPIIQKLGLRLPDMNPPRNESSNPTTGSQSPPKPTMRLSENSFERDLISGSI